MTRSDSARGGQNPFLLKWIAANLLGGFIIGFLENNGLQFMATLMLTGAVIGSFQWWVMRSQLRLRWWPLASAIGWIFGSLLITLYPPVVDVLWQQIGLWEVFWLNLVTATITVLGMALGQGLLLPRQGQSVGIWLLTSILGGAALGAVSASLCAALCQALPPVLVGLVNGLGWAIYGVITGFAWLWMFKHQSDAEVNG